MNENQTIKLKRGQSLILPSPRKDDKLGKIPEDDQIVKLKPTDNVRTSVARGQNSVQPSTQARLARQSTNLSIINAKRRPNKKPNLQVPTSQKLNQLLIGKEALTKNYTKDVENSYNKIEALYMEALPKLGNLIDISKNISFRELFKELVEQYENANTKIDELLQNNEDLNMKNTELENRIQEFSEYNKKECGKLKNQIDEKGVENQRLVDVIQRLEEENKEKSERINDLQAQIVQAAKFSQVVCPECKAISQGDSKDCRVHEANGKEKDTEQHQQQHYPPLMHSMGNFSTRNTRRIVKSDSELYTILRSPKPFKPLSAGRDLLSSPLSTPRSSTPRSSTPRLSSLSPNKISSRKALKDTTTETQSVDILTQQEDHWNTRSNTEFSYSSSHISFANKSVSSLSGHSSRENSELSFVNNGTPCSL